MIYEGINFYPASADGKSEADFIEHEKHTGLSEAQLKEVYSLMTKQDKKKQRKEVPPSLN